MNTEYSDSFDQKDDEVLQWDISYKHHEQFFTDRALIVILENDISHGFTHLVEKYGSYIRKIAQDIVFTDDVEDVVQETFLHAYEALKRYKSERIKTLRLKPWLRTIVKNTSIDFYRRQTSARYMYLSLEVFEESGIQLPDSEITSPELRSILLEDFSAIKKVIEKLPEIDRRILLLRYYKNCSCREIAQMLGRREHAISVRILGLYPSG